MPGTLQMLTMASGDLSLRIAEDVDWKHFPELAEAFVALFQGRVTGRAETVAERVWDVEIRGLSFWLGFDDFGGQVSLDAKSSDCNPVIEDSGPERGRSHT
jgi:hypothetical protein